MSLKEWYSREMKLISSRTVKSKKLVCLPESNCVLCKNNVCPCQEALPQPPETHNPGEEVDEDQEEQEAPNNKSNPTSPHLHTPTPIIASTGTIEHANQTCLRTPPHVRHSPPFDTHLQASSPTTLTKRHQHAQQQ
eukprot:gb/GEZN01024919.1/.p1 GENE.gb/GEZN01024919.1/~~gb/GEZN01024919.1/.p1  ORF type:complete len:136 (-),score=15.43 gb/GEZN01024919.1/:33-440(-)